MIIIELEALVCESEGTNEGWNDIGNTESHMQPA